MRIRSTKNTGFSLVELVMVIVILGIIAAVAVPRITSGSRSAGESALRANLQTLRTAIDWYYVEHNNTFPATKHNGLGPTAGTAWGLISQLIRHSNAAGRVSIPADPDYPFGPYLRDDLPKLTVGANAGLNTVTVVNQAAPLATDVANGSAWIYNLATGEIIANADQLAGDGTPYHNF